MLEKGYPHIAKTSRFKGVTEDSYEVPDSRTVATIGGLKPDTRYLIQVAAFTRKGMDSRSQSRAHHQGCSSSLEVEQGPNPTEENLLRRTAQPVSPETSPDRDHRINGSHRYIYVRFQHPPIKVRQNRPRKSLSGQLDRNKKNKVSSEILKK
ncbi:hypothetical protein RRG08_056525 [Elysia crispata]|uniref:Fibronectin type-III domain-containing protein n=1 Tax=Elysia crispata TaxID=231223 RepID=A0AAE1DHW1_9GAST|nr:hypothetical protein RRG08_056525 [Elysia crispata]